MPPRQCLAASQVDVQIAGGFSAQGGGVAVARDAGDIHSSSARVDGDYGRAAGRDYVEGDTLEFDLTGFRTARGFARFFLIVGTLIALVGFGLFGYMMLDAFGSFQDVMAQSAECDQNFPLGTGAGRSATSTSGLPAIAFCPMGSGGRGRHVRGHGRSTRHRHDDEPEHGPNERSAPVGVRVAVAS